jgi:hypothetical protein
MPPQAAGAPPDPPPDQIVGGTLTLVGQQGPPGPPGPQGPPGKDGAGATVAGRANLLEYGYDPGRTDNEAALYRALDSRLSPGFAGGDTLNSGDWPGEVYLPDVRRAGGGASVCLTSMPVIWDGDNIDLTGDGMTRSRIQCMTGDAPIVVGFRRRYKWLGQLAGNPPLISPDHYSDLAGLNAADKSYVSGPGQRWALCSRSAAGPIPDYLLSFFQGVGRGMDDCYEQAQVLTIDFLIRGFDGGAIGPTPYFGFGDETGPKPWQLCGGNLLNGKSYRFTFRTGDQGKDDYPRRFDFGDPSQAKGWQAGALEVNLKDATVFAWMNGRSIPVALNYGTHDKAGATFPGEPAFTPGLAFQSNDPGAPMNVWASGSYQDSWGPSIPPANRGSFLLGGLRFTNGRRYATDQAGKQVLAPGVAGTLNDDFRYTANQDRARCLFALDTTKGPAGTVADRWVRCQAGPNLTTYHGLFCPATEDVLYNVTVNQTIRGLSLESGANGHAGLVIGKILTFAAKDCKLQGGWHGVASSGGIGPNVYKVKLIDCQMYGRNSWVFGRNWELVARPTDYQPIGWWAWNLDGCNSDIEGGDAGQSSQEMRGFARYTGDAGTGGLHRLRNVFNDNEGVVGKYIAPIVVERSVAGVRLDIDGFAPGSQPPGIPTVLLIDRWGPAQPRGRFSARNLYVEPGATLVKAGSLWDVDLSPTDMRGRVATPTAGGGQVIADAPKP